LGYDGEEETLIPENSLFFASADPGSLRLHNHSVVPA